MRVLDVMREGAGGMPEQTSLDVLEDALQVAVGRDLGTSAGNIERNHYLKYKGCPRA
ncbi:hypothetical protein M413DRAFT_447131 [Hebeloma cylindrosporum]|uniref:Uncharacterized protein n=1 Tax=Hebeloma cylindrosporum TaxID=76867 RepID=A0A0C2XPY9_HEBCY|nr:hypothetical protein M413DRAFT_447131 [Hebeloma cylindrosporum h7]